MARKTHEHVSVNPISNGYVTHTKDGSHYSEKRPKITVEHAVGSDVAGDSGKQAMGAVKALMDQSGSRRRF